ncbi:hypothetical protein J1N35_018522 [Gossypium stocksii]|uniref:Uncharacterized protein n=1 Tax=Gossypium stocksii TaxID=47602 RepID=A0A9D3VR34_9ROSI|nr:hypothetical protein J1N35_018522 [Gossypium stocksii]
MHKERTTRKAKAKSCLYASVSPAIFNRIMAFGSMKEIWDYLKAEYQGDERIKSMKMALHARKLLEATLEATLVKKEFIEGKY